MVCNRRVALTAAAAWAATWTVGCATPSTKPDFVLVHGAWHGAWCWDRVTPILRQAGHRVFTPTLPGQGERAAELSADVNLETHIADVVQYIESRRLQNVVLVGHSYGGLVVSGVADRIAPRLRKLIYLDALVLDSGQSIAALSGASWENRLKAVREQGRGLGLPALPPEAFGVLEPQDQAWLAPRLTLQPVHTFDQPLVLRNPLGNGVPKVYIDCNQPAMGSVNAFKAKVKQQAGWTAYETLPTGHDAMVTLPEGLVQLFLEHA
ncbi:MAG TPA: alpha/beta fold hydrolase [Ramlibacter sp.]|uniref:alpha/beta fold hydrolase n=1 Tax=Ramlibacter sp. TaxID=1917967 RepID=UPI002C33E182|nr:alpha/beta fold hydrolase [Ramlibacter sp.]HVZ45240.1 alpha/beta fold hydrolase [Ramlibacter sp.]